MRSPDSSTQTIAERYADSSAASTRAQETVSDKLSREVRLLYEGSADGISNSIQHAADDKLGTALKFAGSAVLGTAYSVLSARAGIVGQAARIAGTSMAASFLWDIGGRADSIGAAMADTWSSAESFDRSKGAVANAVGPFVADFMIGSAGGFAGMGLARVPAAAAGIERAYVRVGSTLEVGAVGRQVEMLGQLRAHSPTMYHHSRRVGALSELVAGNAGLNPTHARLAGLGHDLGKVTTPIPILHSERALLPQQMRIMQNHVVESKAIMENTVRLPQRFKPVEQGVAQHHEALDGSGYPLGLKGDQVSPLGRVLRAVDVFDSITSVDRSYTQRKSLATVLRIMLSERNGKADPKMIDALFDLPANKVIAIMESSPARPSPPSLRDFANIKLGRLLDVATGRREGSAFEADLANRFKSIYNAPSLVEFTAQR